MRVLITLCVLSLLSFQTFAAFRVSGDGKKTECPFFYLEKETPNSVTLDLLPLHYIDYDFKIAGVIADVSLTQTYVNNYEYPIEAIYVFPASTRAAIYELDMKIKDRTIKAEIQEKNQARLTYHLAKAQGKSASLLEQVNPNVFQMQVGG